MAVAQIPVEEYSKFNNYSVEGLEKKAKRQATSRGNKAIGAPFRQATALPLFFACAGLCKLGPRFIYRICVEIVLLFVSVVTFIFVRKGQSIGSLTFARGSVGGFIVSSYEAVFVCALFIVAFSLQLYLVADRRYYGEANVIVGGALAVMGVFLPRLLEGYEFLQSHCEFRGCDSRDHFMIDISEVSIALSISMATLFLAGVTLPAWGAWIDRIFSCGGGVVEGSESSL